MEQASHLARWLARWTHGEGRASTGCGSPGCPGPSSLAARFWPKRTGAYLQGVFYCSRRCLEAALTAQLARLHALTPATPPANRIPLGLLMVARGWLTHEQVVQALAAQQRAKGGQIGDWFEKLGFASAQQVTSALALQWGCPVTTSLDSAASQPLDRIPLGILESLQMIPLHFEAATGTLYVAFGQRVDHAALYAIEKIVDCRTRPCVASRRSVSEELARLRQRPRPQEIEFGPMTDCAEIARISVSYMARLGSEEARLGRVGSFLWLRLRTQQSHTDIVFRLKAAMPAKEAVEISVREARARRRPASSG